MHLDAAEHGDTLVFLHAVKDGPANRSFGLQVAALAGVPKPVIATARERLFALEANPPAAAAATARSDAPQQFGLFDTTPAALTALRALDPDQMSPRDALEALYRLKSLA